MLDRGSDGSAVDYLNSLGIDEKLRQTSNSGPLYFIQDHLASTSALTDGFGNVLERMQYEAFGESAGSALTRYGYTGRERDAATGLMYYRARWYDSQQGRFLSEDPIGENGSLNLYAYVGNNPIRNIDPLGLKLSKAECDRLKKQIALGIKNSRAALDDLASVAQAAQEQGAWAQFQDDSFSLAGALIVTAFALETGQILGEAFVASTAQQYALASTPGLIPTAAGWEAAAAIDAAWSSTLFEQAAINALLELAHLNGPTALLAAS